MTIGPLIVSNSSYTVGSEVIKTQAHTNLITVAGEIVHSFPLHVISVHMQCLGVSAMVLQLQASPQAIYCYRKLFHPQSC